MNRNFAWDKRHESGDTDLSSAPDTLLADLEALRTHDRFGISSWPQMIVCDPRNDQVFDMPPRTVDGVIKLFERTVALVPDPGSKGRRLDRAINRAYGLLERGRVKRAVKILEPIASGKDDFLAWQESGSILKKIRGEEESIQTRLMDIDPAERAIALEQLFLELERKEERYKEIDPDLKEQIEELLLSEDQDLVVRQRSLWCLVRADPATVLRNAHYLLMVPNDPFRYQVLGVIERMPDPSLGRDLITIFREAGKTIPSLNPNVLRINTVRAIMKSGDESCVEALAEVVTDPDPRNYLNSLVIEALGSMGSRGDSALKMRIIDVLLDSFPGAMEAGGEDPQLYARNLRLHLGLVEKVVASLKIISGVDELPALPEVWNGNARDAFLTELSAIFKKVRPSAGSDHPMR